MITGLIITNFSENLSLLLPQRSLRKVVGRVRASYLLNDILFREITVLLLPGAFFRLGAISIQLRFHTSSPQILS